MNINKKSRFTQYLSSTSFYKRFLYSFIFFYIFITFINNFYYFYEILRLELGLEAFLQTFFDFSNFTSNYAVMFYIFIIVLTSINMTLFIKFLQDQKIIVDRGDKNSNKNGENEINYQHINRKNKRFKKLESIKSFVFILMSIFISNCASCGIILFGGVLSFGSSVFFIKYGIYLQVFTAFIVIANIYYLIKKINSPFVC